MEAKGFLPPPLSPISASVGIKCPSGRGRTGRIGLQLPTNYVLKGRGNAFWNKSLAIKVSLDRRCRERKRLSQVSDPWLQHRQQQLMMQQQHTMILQAQQQGYEDEGSSDDSSSRRRKEKSSAGQKAKAIFAFLMLPSLIVIFNSHKKINKEESNVDIAALRAGGFGGMGSGVAGGLPGMDGLGAGGMGMGRGMGEQEIPGVMPGRHPGMSGRESADEYTRRLLSRYKRGGDDDPSPVSEDPSGPAEGSGDGHDALARGMRDPFDPGQDEAADDVHDASAEGDYDGSTEPDSLIGGVTPDLEPGKEIRDQEAKRGGSADVVEEIPADDA